MHNWRRQATFILWEWEFLWQTSLEKPELRGYILKEAIERRFLVNPTGFTYAGKGMISVFLFPNKSTGELVTIEQ